MNVRRLGSVIAVFFGLFVFTVEVFSGTAAAAKFTCTLGPASRAIPTPCQSPGDLYQFNLNQVSQVSVQYVSADLADPTKQRIGDPPPVNVFLSVDAPGAQSVSLGQQMLGFPASTVALTGGFSEPTIGYPKVGIVTGATVKDVWKIVITVSPSEWKLTPFGWQPIAIF